VIKQGNGLIEDTTMGPLVSAQQQKRVKSYIDKGVEEGAEILTGGSLPFEKGYFVEPTIFADVDHSMTIAREEIFGPVVAAMPFDDLDDLIANANDTTYGLAAGVWTQDLKKAHYVAHGIKA
ncbi:aldehyde dehydrogenase family protein, partial [Escherichia coli]|nr:aldehyde dehydrogenase family protein [Escherichia coli]